MAHHMARAAKRYLAPFSIAGVLAATSPPLMPGARAAPDNTLGMAMLFARVGSTGVLVRSAGATGASSPATGKYLVAFDRDVSQCVYQATIGYSDGFLLPAGEIQVTPSLTDPAVVEVATNISTTAGNTYVGRSFHLLVFCAR